MVAHVRDDMVNRTLGLEHPLEGFRATSSQERVGVSHEGEKRVVLRIFRNIYPNPYMWRERVVALVGVLSPNKTSDGLNYGTGCASAISNDTFQHEAFSFLEKFHNISQQSDVLVSCLILWFKINTFDLAFAQMHDSQEGRLPTMLTLRQQYLALDLSTSTTVSCLIEFSRVYSLSAALEALIVMSICRIAPVVLLISELSARIDGFALALGISQMRSKPCMHELLAQLVRDFGSATVQDENIMDSTNVTASRTILQLLLRLFSRSHGASEGRRISALCMECLMDSVRSIQVVNLHETFSLWTLKQIILSEDRTSAQIMSPSLDDVEELCDAYSNDFATQYASYLTFLQRLIQTIPTQSSSNWIPSTLSLVTHRCAALFHFMRTNFNFNRLYTQSVIPIPNTEHAHGFGYV
jgi:hypothetical protein